MRVVERRSPWLQIAAVLVGFFLGPVSATRLSAFLAPGSITTELASLFGFALVFILGTTLWMGFGVASVVVRALRDLIRPGRSPRGKSEPARTSVPPGYGSYLAVGVILGAMVGLLAGVATPLSLARAIPAWGILGLMYGCLLWSAAHYGYLPFPEPE